MMNKREKFLISSLLWFTGLVLLFVIIYFLSIVKFNNAYMEEEYHELPIFQKQIEYAISPYLENKDFKSLEKYCRIFENTDVKIKIFDKDKKLIASSLTNDKESVLDESQDLNADSQNKRKFDIIDRHKIIGLVKKVQPGNEAYYLKLTVSEEDVMKILLQAQHYLFLFILLFILFVISSIIYIIQKLRIPFNVLQESVIKIANGELDTEIKVPKLELLEELAVCIKKMTQRLKNQINRLKQLEEYKSDFIQNVSHEIKTPITAINSAIELLELKNNINEQDKECYEIIVHQSKMLNSLVNDILSLSEIEVEKTGEHKNFKRFALNEVIESIINYTIHSDIKINLINKHIINLLGDKELISTAVSNLLINAVKYSKSENIDVIISCVENFAQIEVKDYGIGISQEHLHFLFDRFYRVDKARSRKNGGTGLGLAIVKNITELHNGTIAVKSNLGEGSNFIIRIPMKDT